MSSQHYSKHIIYSAKLINQEALPTQAQNHPLTGKYRDTREFHISGDLLLIYLYTDTELVLIRIGTHTQLFD